MSQCDDFLFELGCEELPATQIAPLMNALEQEFIQALNAAKLEFKAVSSFATPRRLALLCTQLNYQQAQQKIMKRGPAVVAAFDKAGKPSAAAEGFARSCGVAVSELARMVNDKGEWLAYEHVEEGKSTKELLPNLLEVILKKLPMKKTMRWGSSPIQFLRPVHWLILLHGKTILPGTILGLEAENKTYGHRFLAPSNMPVIRPAEYESNLLKQGYVVASVAERRERIQTQLKEQASQVNGVVMTNDTLLNEVVQLVEWPCAICVPFDKSFLNLPKEVLMASMIGHQKCFPVFEDKAQQRLLPYFITVSNLKESKDDLIRKGNARVMKARLSDAAFFYQEDLKRPLLSRIVQLDKIIFQEKLGSLGNKVQRIVKLSENIALQCQLNEEEAKQTALLAKADLTTAMVQEFPELQGIMGAYYARHEGMSERIVKGIREHYLPRFATDKLPSTQFDCVVAIADRVDTLVGIISIGLQPTGDKDPFALRRAAIALIRIWVDFQLPLDIKPLIHYAAKLYEVPAAKQQALVDQVMSFIWNRQRAWCVEQGVSKELFNAVIAAHPYSPYDVMCRINAMQYFLQLPEADSLTAANKRVSNLLKKVSEVKDVEVNTNLLSLPQEIALAEAIQQHSQQLTSWIESRDYQAVLRELSTSKQVVDDFFDSVMVMDKNEAIRNNRLALLKTLQDLFLQVADLSEI